MPEKAIYSLTEAGEAEFERLMFEISGNLLTFSGLQRCYCEFGFLAT